jgi:hypothetical protein
LVWQLRHAVGLARATPQSKIEMKPQPEASSQEVLAGLVERVTHHNAENGFCVLRAKVRGRGIACNPSPQRVHAEFQWDGTNTALQLRSG